MKERIFALALGVALGLVSPAIAQSGTVIFNGAANQVLGINSRGTAPEPKSILGAGTVAVTHASEKITLTGTPQRFSAVSTKGVDFAADVGNVYRVTATATATLATAVGKAGQEVLIQNIDDADTVTMASTSSQTINGGAAGSVTIAAGAQKHFISDGANWVSY